MKRNYLSLFLTGTLFIMISCGGGGEYAEEAEEESTEATAEEAEEAVFESFVAFAISHEVSDYGEWRAVFNEVTAGNESVMGVFQSMDNPNSVIVYMSSESHEAASEFFNSEELKADMERSGVASDPVFNSFDVVTMVGPEVEYDTPYRMAVSHEVADVDAWKVLFDEHDGMREESGIHFVGMGVDGENANMVHVFFALDDLDKAKAFLEGEDLKAAMEKSGVTSEPSVMWLTATEGEGDDSGS